MRFEKFGSKRNWSWLGFALAKYGGLAFCHGFLAILVGKCHKCMQNEVWKVSLQKELILVGIGLAK